MADLVFGPDANYYQSLQNGAANVSADDFAIKQAYVALRAQSATVSTFVWVFGIR